MTAEKLSESFQMLQFEKFNHPKCISSYVVFAFFYHIVSESRIRFQSRPEKRACRIKYSCKILLVQDGLLIVTPKQKAFCNIYRFRANLTLGSDKKEICRT